MRGLPCHQQRCLLSGRLSLPGAGGDGTYIRRDYGLSISDFYSQVWWPDLTQLAERYGIRYTGVMIENYEDDTLSAPQRQTDTEQFRYFGGLLLRQGGEIGYHATTTSALSAGY